MSIIEKKLYKFWITFNFTISANFPIKLFFNKITIFKFWYTFGNGFFNSPVFTCNNFRNCGYVLLVEDIQSK
jgi:hypothetical protein